MGILSAHDLHIATLADMRSLPERHSVSVGWVCMTSFQRKCVRACAVGAAPHIPDSGGIYKVPLNLGLPESAGCSLQLQLIGFLLIYNSQFLSFPAKRCARWMLGCAAGKL